MHCQIQINFTAAATTRNATAHTKQYCPDTFVSYITPRQLFRKVIYAMLAPLREEISKSKRPVEDILSIFAELKQSIKETLPRSNNGPNGRRYQRKGKPVYYCGPFDDPQSENRYHSSESLLLCFRRLTLPIFSQG
jgi:hypothetical protein